MRKHKTKENQDLILTPKIEDVDIWIDNFERSQNNSTQRDISPSRRSKLNLSILNDTVYINKNSTKKPFLYKQSTDSPTKMNSTQNLSIASREENNVETILTHISARNSQKSPLLSRTPIMTKSFQKSNPENNTNSSESQVMESRRSNSTIQQVKESRSFSRISIQ